MKLRPFSFPHGSQFLWLKPFPPPLRCAAWPRALAPSSAVPPRSESAVSGSSLEPSAPSVRRSAPGAVRTRGQASACRRRFRSEDHEYEEPWRRRVGDSGAGPSRRLSLDERNQRCRFHVPAPLSEGAFVRDDSRTPRPSPAAASPFLCALFFCLFNYVLACSLTPFDDAQSLVLHAMLPRRRTLGVLPLRTTFSNDVTHRRFVLFFTSTSAHATIEAEGKFVKCGRCAPSTWQQR